MEVHYKFVTGEIHTFVVQGEVAEAIKLIQDEQKKSNRRETRRHESYYALEDEDDVHAADGAAVTEDMIVERMQLKQILAVLTPEQRALLWRVYVEGVPMTAIAQEEDVAESTIRYRVSKALSILAETTSK